MPWSNAAAPLHSLAVGAAGKFPRSFKIGDPDAGNGRKAWSRSEILAWLADRMAARNAPRPRHPLPAIETASKILEKVA
jgi:hypothetical protein